MSFSPWAWLPAASQRGLTHKTLRLCIYPSVCVCARVLTQMHRHVILLIGWIGVSSYWQAPKLRFAVTFHMRFPSHSVNSFKQFWRCRGSCFVFQKDADEAQNCWWHNWYPKAMIHFGITRENVSRCSSSALGLPIGEINLRRASEETTAKRKQVHNYSYNHYISLQYMRFIRQAHVRSTKKWLWASICRNWSHQPFAGANFGVESDAWMTLLHVWVLALVLCLRFASTYRDKSKSSFWAPFICSPMQTQVWTVIP